MTAERETLLNQAYKKALEIGFGMAGEPDVRLYFAGKLMVVGTAKDELITTLPELQSLVHRQREQREEVDMSFVTTPLFRSYLANDTVAVIVEEVVFEIKTIDGDIQFAVRCSAVLNFDGERWTVVYWHISKPDEAPSEEDTFGIAEEESKTEELEKTVAALTADLVSTTNRLTTALSQLQTTQAQLIQSEKMASLGELTAGIAHEIQNPLNFVNNFSEVNGELMKELKKEMAGGNVEAATAIAGDIEANWEKIAHHGKRADAIVKGMLQHSRASSGQKEPTDVNALADECLRLAYHGLRAKDKSFTSAMKTDFDNNAGKINVVPQDMGRVLLNLFTNAFYAVHEKAARARAMGDNDYAPTVAVGTRRLGDKIEITVSDNGDGIPQKVLDKIFQPFFTTKPTGRGTGLGLSMSYDIVTKEHGGELSVETGEGKGTAFIIRLTA